MSVTSTEPKPYPYVEENDFSTIDAEMQPVYQRELARMCEDAKEDVFRMRQKTSIIALNDPEFVQPKRSQPPPRTIKPKPTFQAQLKARIATTAGFRQPFSNLPGLVTITQNGVALLWDAQRSKRYEWFNVTRGGIITAAVNKSGSLMVTGGLSCHAEIFSIGKELNERIYYAEAQQANLPLYNAKPGERAETGRPANFRSILSGHDDAVTAVFFNTDTACLSFGQDGQVLAHDVLSGLCQMQIEYSSSVNAADGVPNSPNEYVVGLRNGNVCLGDLRTQRVGVDVVNGLPAPEKVRVFPDGHTMVVAYKNEVELLDLRSFGSFDSFKCDVGNISALDVSPSGRMLLCGTDSGEATTLDMVQHAWAPRPFTKRNDRISGIHLLDDKIYVASWDGSLGCFKLKE